MKSRQPEITEVKNLGKLIFDDIYKDNTGAYFLKARTPEPEKQPLLANDSETTFVCCPLLGNSFLTNST
jgi:hypothetical protein